MTITSFWDCWLLSVRATGDGGWEVRVGAAFVLAAVWLAYKIIGWCGDEVEKVIS